MVSPLTVDISASLTFCTSWQLLCETKTAIVSFLNKLTWVAWTLISFQEPLQYRQDLLCGDCESGCSSCWVNSTGLVNFSLRKQAPKKVNTIGGTDSQHVRPEYKLLLAFTWFLSRFLSAPHHHLKWIRGWVHTADTNFIHLFTPFLTGMTHNKMCVLCPLFSLHVTCCLLQSKLPSEGQSIKYSDTNDVAASYFRNFYLVSCQNNNVTSKQLSNNLKI